MAKLTTYRPLPIGSIALALSWGMFTPRFELTCIEGWRIPMEMTDMYRLTAREASGGQRG
jgi:hypothetical protein